MMIPTGKSTYEALDAAIDGATPLAAALFTDAVAGLADLYATNPRRAAAVARRWLTRGTS
jgi:hypothetical protein